MRCGPPCRENERAWVSVNGKTCWRRYFVGSTGNQTCGQKNGNEERVPVKCTADAKNGQFAVRVYTTLNSGASDESFGIDNAVLKKYTPPPCKAAQYMKDKKCVACPKGSTCDGNKATVCKAPKIVKHNTCMCCGPFQTITENFQNAKDQHGWSCGKITKCGAFGNICGGFNVKGQSHDIKKTFNDLPYGGQTFEISLDFIKIDSWFVEDRVT